MSNQFLFKVFIYKKVRHVLICFVNRPREIHCLFTVQRNLSSIRSWKTEIIPNRYSMISLSLSLSLHPKYHKDQRNDFYLMYYYNNICCCLCAGNDRSVHEELFSKLCHLQKHLPYMGACRVPQSYLAFAATQDF